MHGVSVLLILALVLTKAIDKIKDVIILLMGNSWMYFIEVNFASKQIFLIFILTQILQNFYIFFD